LAKTQSTTPFGIFSAMFFFPKDSLVESMIYQLKYKGQQEIETFLGNWMGSYLKESNIFS
tara:strand:+ start:63 stop:242 length:180 start_codon:yes stop_codon:yes gene_type:complete